MKEKIKNLVKNTDFDISQCDEYLKDLPEDIEDVSELEDMIGNNKDLSRAYDLGRRDTLRAIKNELENIKNEL